MRDFFSFFKNLFDCFVEKGGKFDKPDRLFYSVKKDWDVNSF